MPRDTKLKNMQDHLIPIPTHLTDQDASLAYSNSFENKTPKTIAATDNKNTTAKHIKRRREDENICYVFLLGLIERFAKLKKSLVLNTTSMFIIILQLQQIVISSTIVYPHCAEHESCFNQTIINHSNVTCKGSQSCNYSYINTSILYCHGYGACSDSNYNSKSHRQISGSEVVMCDGANSCLHSNISSGDLLVCDGYGSCSNSELKLTSSYTTALLDCHSLHACTNSIFKSDTSYNDIYGLNDRFINMFLEGVFDSYNTSVYSNGNNIYSWIGLL